MQWAAFERVHGPILLHDRIEVMVAQLCAVMSGGKPADFLPKWDEETRGQSVESMLAVIDSAVASARGGP